MSYTTITCSNRLLRNPVAGIFYSLTCVTEVFYEPLGGPSASHMLVRCAAFQVSCLGVELSMDGDDSRFVLTSRNPDASVVRFQLQASSTETCRAWINDVGQILESQRNFLNGEEPRLTFRPQNFYVDSYRSHHCSSASVSLTVAH